ncbi:basic proline-rich protein-like [Choloepus didactylus]|uniref:basic proline-rich protein-like n=1 Tax=Choloepus didactylus TaxID=27675 RepID=UPI00189D075C|nr:basic proline-rich protein-like [Choloepus didactylus]
MEQRCHPHQAVHETVQEPLQLPGNPTPPGQLIPPVPNSLDAYDPGPARGGRVTVPHGLVVWGPCSEPGDLPPSTSWAQGPILHQLSLSLSLLGLASGTEQDVTTSPSHLGPLGQNHPSSAPPLPALLTSAHRGVPLPLLLPEAPSPSLQPLPSPWSRGGGDTREPPPLPVCRSLRPSLEDGGVCFEPPRAPPQLPAPEPRRSPHGCGISIPRRARGSHWRDFSQTSGGTSRERLGGTRDAGVSGGRLSAGWSPGAVVAGARAPRSREVGSPSSPRLLLAPRPPPASVSPRRGRFFATFASPPASGTRPGAPGSAAGAAQGGGRRPSGRGRGASDSPGAGPAPAWLGRGARGAPRRARAPETPRHRRPLPPTTEDRGPARPAPRSPRPRTRPAPRSSRPRARHATPTSSSRHAPPTSSPRPRAGPAHELATPRPALAPPTRSPPPTPRPAPTRRAAPSAPTAGGRAGVLLSPQGPARTPAGRARPPGRGLRVRPWGFSPGPRRRGPVRTLRAFCRRPPCRSLGLGSRSSWGSPPRPGPSRPALAAWPPPPPQPQLPGLRAQLGWSDGGRRRWPVAGRWDAGPGMHFENRLQAPRRGCPAGAQASLSPSLP